MPNPNNSGYLDDNVLLLAGASVLLSTGANTYLAGIVFGGFAGEP